MVVFLYKFLTQMSHVIFPVTDFHYIIFLLEDILDFEPVETSFMLGQPGLKSTENNKLTTNNYL